MDNELNLDNDMELSEYHLERHAKEQAKLYKNYGTEHANAKDKLRKVKDRLDVARAELDKEIRSNLEKFFPKTESKKVTNPAIESAIISHPRYRKLAEESLQAELEVDLCAVAVRSMEHRRDSIDGLIRLHGQNYYATPPKAYGQIRDDEKESSRRRLGEQMRSRRADRSSSDSE